MKQLFKSVYYSAGANDAAKPPRRSAKEYLFICVKSFSIQNLNRMSIIYFASITICPSANPPPLACNIIFPTLPLGRTITKHFPRNVLCSGF